MMAGHEIHRREAQGTGSQGEAGEEEKEGQEVKRLIFLLMVLALAGCAELKVAADIVDIFVPDPDPVCSEKTRGDVWQNGDKGMICAKIPGGYEWVYFAPINRVRK